MDDSIDSNENGQGSPDDFTFNYNPLGSNSTPVGLQANNNQIVNINFSPPSLLNSPEVNRFFTEVEISRYLQDEPEGEDFHDRSRKFQKLLLSSILNQVRSQNLVMLDLERGIPTWDLLIEVTGDLLYSLSSYEKSNGRNSILTYRYIGGEEDNIELELLKIEGPAVILFQNVSRKNFGWQLKQLAQKSAEHHLYLIASTDLPQDVWRLSSYEKAYLYEVTSKDLYNADYLIKYLRDGIKDKTLKIPGVIRQVVSSEEVQKNGLSALTIALDLSSPENINNFLSEAQNLKSLSLEDIPFLVEKHKHHNLYQTISGWFEGLSPQDQLFALGLTFFDGLEEDKVYALTQHLMKNVWLVNTGTQMLDRGHFRNLMDFFKFVPARYYGDQIERRFEQQRMLLLKAAVISHPLRIRNGLGWLIELISKGKQNTSLKDVYPDGKVPLLLRKTIVETIIDLAFYNFDFAEPLILQLMIQSDKKTQELIASSFARWYRLGELGKLMDLFHRWRTKKISITRLKNLMTLGSKNGSPIALFNAMFVLIATFAAESDQPGAMAQAWVTELTNLANVSDEEIVRSSFRDKMIPLLVPSQSSHVEPILRNLIRYAEIIEPLGKAFAEGYADHPNDIWKIINNWYQEGQRGFRQGTDIELVEQSKRLLEVVVIFLMKISISNNGPFNVPTVFTMLRQLGNCFPSGKYQVAIWRTEIQLSQQRPDYFQQLLAEASEPEYDRLVAILTETYLAQRSDLPNPDDCMKTKDKLEIPVFVNRQRPSTTIENQLLGSLLNPNNGKVILRTLLSFASKVDIEEEAFVRECQSKQYFQSIQASPQPVIIHQEETPIAPLRKKDFYLDELVPVLATLMYPNFRANIRNLIPEILSKIGAPTQELEFVAFHLSISSDPRIQNFGHCLTCATDLIKKGREWGINIVGISAFWEAVKTLISEHGLGKVILLYFNMDKQYKPPIFIKTILFLLILLPLLLIFGMAAIFLFLL